MNKKTIWALIILIILAVIIVIANNSASKASAVKIGVISPLTGWGAYWGEGYNKGVELAIDEIKAKGGDVSVVIEDGATDAQKSASAAQKLVSIDKVDGLTVEFTAPSSSVSPISVQNKVPMVYDALVKKFVTENPYAFKFYFDVGKQCSIAAKYLASHGAKNIGVLSVNVDFASECQTSVEKVAQETGVKTVMYAFNTDVTDFRTIIAKMKSDGIDSLIPVFYEDHAISFFKQKNDLGFNVQTFMGIGIPDGLTEKVRSSVPQASIESIMTYDQPLDPSFRTRLVAKYPTIAEKDYVPAAYGYDEIMYLYDGLSKCSKGNIDCIITKMKEDTRIGILQSAGFGEDRVLDMNPVYYRYTGGKLVEFNPSTE